LRLRQMVNLTREVERATKGDLNMDWLKPFTTTRRVSAGEVMFRKGDPAAEMFVVVSGRFRLAEIGIDIVPPGVVGELAWLAPERARTQTLECAEDGTVLQIGYKQVEQLFFQNPKFGFFFLRLIAQRLFDTIARLEGELARLRSGGAKAPDVLASST
jgi:CRP-like cAMP-binding protein